MADVYDVVLGAEVAGIGGGWGMRLEMGMVAGRGRRCHPLQVASPELEGIIVWGCGVAMVTC